LSSKSQNLNQDSLFGIVKELGYSKEYKKSETFCKQLINSYPNNMDYKVFLARLYAWQNDFNTARNTLVTIPESYKSNSEVMDLLIDIELWSGNYETAVLYCNKALAVNNEKKETTMLKKAKSQLLLDDYKNALTTLDELLAINSASYETLALKDIVLEKSMKNQVSLSYLNSSFSNPSFKSWHFTSIEYKRGFRKCPIIVRATYGNLNPGSGTQFELDAYPKIARKTYLYLNIGVAEKNTIFPLFRATFDVYQKLGKQFEASLGLRYLHFSIVDVYIYTPSLTWYYKNWKFTYRPYFVTPNSQIFTSHTLQARKYFKKNDTYFSINAIYGSAPFLYAFYQDIARLNSQRIGFDFQFRLGKSLFIRPFVMYDYEEYYPTFFRNRFDAQITVSKKF
jgi:YaiO family outer membrane protein